MSQVPVGVCADGVHIDAIPFRTPPHAADTSVATWGISTWASTTGRRLATARTAHARSGAAVDALELSAAGRAVVEVRHCMVMCLITRHRGGCATDVPAQRVQQALRGRGLCERSAAAQAPRFGHTSRRAVSTGMSGWWASIKQAFKGEDWLKPFTYGLTGVVAYACVFENQYPHSAIPNEGTAINQSIPAPQRDHVFSFIQRSWYKNHPTAIDKPAAPSDFSFSLTIQDKQSNETTKTPAKPQ